MPSPFPGMDPYLEGSLWMSVHAQLASVFVRQLNPQLLPRYIALSERRHVLEMPEDSEVTVGPIYPDVAVVRPEPAGVDLGATGTIIAPIRMATLMRSPVPHITVAIRDVANRELVAVIEVLSPTNKRGEGYDEYVERRERILRSSAHLIEIDLLRKGQRVPMQRALPSVPYFVFLCRAHQRPLTEVYPITLDQPLPQVPVPLLPADADAKLDLQQALAVVYDECGLNYMIDYSKPPEIPLSPEQAAWVDEHLRAAGLRP
ncbi:MAG: DUF4058 family protein [Isosphaeraceae bacterium]